MQTGANLVAPPLWIGGQSLPQDLVQYHRQADLLVQLLFSTFLTQLFIILFWTKLYEQWLLERWRGRPSESLMRDLAQKLDWVAKIMQDEILVRHVQLACLSAEMTTARLWFQCFVLQGVTELFLIFAWKTVSRSSDIALFLSAKPLFDLGTAYSLQNMYFYIWSLQKVLLNTWDCPFHGLQS